MNYNKEAVETLAKIEVEIKTLCIDTMNQSIELLSRIDEDTLREHEANIKDKIVDLNETLDHILSTSLIYE